MKNKQNLMFGILVISLMFNFFSWQELQNFNQSHRDVARQHDVESLRNEISTITQTAQNILKEKQWVQNVNFVVVNEASNKKDKVLKGEWSLGELEKGQVPELWLRERGSDTWIQLSLDETGGLTYSANLTVSPEKQYEFKLVAEGNPTRASEIQELPYHLYGLPIGWVDFVSSREEKDNVIFDMHLNFDTATPDMNINPKEAYIEIIRKGSVEQKIDFKGDPDPHMDFFTAQWKVSKKLLSEYEPYLVVKYENGLIKRTPIEVFEKFRYELNR